MRKKLYRVFNEATKTGQVKIFTHSLPEGGGNAPKVDVKQQKKNGFPSVFW